MSVPPLEAPAHLRGSMRGRKGAIIAERYRLARQWRDAGHTLAAIGQAFGLSISGTHDILRKDPVHRPAPDVPAHLRGRFQGHGQYDRRAFIDERNWLVRELRADGYTYAAIGQALGMGPQGAFEAERKAPPGPVAPAHLRGRIRTLALSRERETLAKQWASDGHTVSDLARAFHVSRASAERIRDADPNRTDGRAARPAPPAPPEAPAHLIGLGTHAKANRTPERVPALIERWHWIQDRKREGCRLGDIGRALRIKGNLAGAIAREPCPELPPPAAPIDVQGLAVGAKVEQREWTEARVRDGYSLDAIADALGVTRTFVLRIRGRV